MVNGRANGPLRQSLIAALADELDYGRKGPWSASIRKERVPQRRDLIRHAGSRPLRATLSDLAQLRRAERSRRRDVRAMHEAARLLLRRCAEANEPFTLLLRDFDAEALSLRTKRRLWGPVVEYRSMGYLRWPPPDAAIRPLLETLAAEHPVISVLNPESRPLQTSVDLRQGLGGVHFLALSPANWFTVVPRLAEAATMVLVLAAEAGPGLTFELEMLDALAAHDRTVIVMTEAEDDGDRLIGAAGAELLAEYRRRRSARQSLVESALFGRFGRRARPGELAAIGMADRDALAAQWPFAGLLPLRETARPNAPVRNDPAERRLRDAAAEIDERRRTASGVDELTALLDLMLRTGAEYNELRRYGTAARLARDALATLAGFPELPPPAKALMSLPFRDLLITASTNSGRWRDATAALEEQLAALGVGSDEDWVRGQQEQAAQRMWMHLARVRRESRVPTDGIEAALRAWSESAGSGDGRESNPPGPDTGPHRF